MHLRRSLALLSGALLLTAPLASCGFDPATNRINTIAAGTNDRDAGVDVLGAVVVSAEEGSGTFIATFVNNDTSEPATIESLEPQEGSAQVVDFSPIEVDPNGLVNLAQDDQGVAVEGDFGAGDHVAMTLRIAGEDAPVELDVPVVPNCREWEGLDGPTAGECEVGEPVGDEPAVGE